MIARKETTTITMKQDQEELIEERVGQQQPPERGQFRLQVDRQTKRSYATYEAAAQVGMATKVITRSFRWRCTIVWQA